MDDPIAAPARQAAGSTATLPSAFAAVLALDGTALQVDCATLDGQSVEADRFVGRALWDCHCWGEGDALRVPLRQAIRQAAAGQPQRRAVRLPGHPARGAEFHVIPRDTGTGDRDRQRAADAGFDAHLVHPADHGALVTLLDR